MLAFFTSSQRGTYLDFRTLRAGKNGFDDLRRVLTCDFFAANPAMGLAGAGKKHSEVVINLSSGSYGRARIVTSASLLDGNRRRQPRNVGDRRFLHLFEKLSGVGAQRLDIFPASFGINRIESERAFPEPLMPVITTILSRGILRLIFLRLCSQAPVILIAFSVFRAILRLC